MTRLRDLATWLLFGVILFWVVPALGIPGEDTAAASWLAAAYRAEQVAPFGHFSIWHQASGAVSPEPAFVLLLARFAGPHAAETSFAIAVATLALVWGAAASRLVPAGGLVERGVAVVASLAVLAIAQGRWTVLAAAPLAWLAVELARERRRVPLVAAVVALALLSRGGLALALPLLAGTALWVGAARDERTGAIWIAAAVALVALLTFDAPEWAHLLRFSAADAFADSGALAAKTVPLADVWRVFGEGALPGVLAAVLLVGAALGAARAPGSPAVVALIAVALLLRLASPHRFLAILVPSALLHPVPAIATALAAAFAVALLGAADRRPQVILAVLAIFGAGLLARAHLPDASEPDAPPTVAIPATGTGIALPLSPRTDLAWRQRLRGDARLANGLQIQLDRNPPLLAAELPRLDAAQLGRWLRRLDLDWALTSKSVVFARKERVPRRRACLEARDWSVDATRGDPDVSLPARALDGNPRTRWGTGGPQKAGDFFAIELPAPRALRSLDIDYAAFGGDHPRGFRVLIAERDGELRPWITRDPYVGEVRWSEGFPYFGARRAGRIRVPLGGRKIRKLRIELTRPARRVDWSIAELCLRPEAVP